MDQIPPTSQQTIAIVSTAQNTDTTLNNGRQFLNDSQKVLDLFKERSTVHEKEINTLSLLAQQHAELSTRLQTLEQKVEEQDKLFTDLQQQITQNKTQKEPAITECENTHTSLFFKKYGGGVMAALLLACLWYATTHK